MNLNITTFKNISVLRIDNNKFILTLISNDDVIYEDIFSLCDIKTPFNNDLTYNMILDCISKSLNYSLFSAFSNGCYYLKFQTTLGHYEVSFILKLSKKTIDNKICNKETDEKQNEKLNEIITEYEDKIKEIKKIYENEILNIMMDMSKLEVKFTKQLNNNNNVSVNLYFPVNSKELKILNINEPEKIKLFYLLEKLYYSSNKDKLDIENINLKELTLNAPEITTLEGIDKLPNLEILELVKCDKLYDIKTFLTNTKIKKLVLRKCSTNQKCNLTTFCKAKDIEIYFM